MAKIIFSLVQSEKDHLVLRLSVEGEITKRILYQDFLESFNTQKDDLKLLMREELAFKNLSFLSSLASTTPFNLIHIPLSRAGVTIERLAKSSGLYLSGKKLSFNPVPLDPLTLHISYVKDQMQIEGVLGEIPLTTCSWLFFAKQAWVVHNGVLSKVKGSIRKLYWDLVYPNATLLVGQRQERILDQLDEGIDAPQIKWLNEPPKPQTLAPTPILQLTDRSGAFADLYFEYNEKRCARHDPVKCKWRSDAEEKLLESDLIEAGYRAQMIEGSHYFCPLNHVSETITFLIELGWKVLDREGREVRLLSKDHIEIQEKGEIITISGTAAFEKEEVPLTLVFQSMKRNEALLPLSSNSVGLIDKEKLSKKWGGIESQQIMGTQVHIKRMLRGLLANIPEASKQLSINEATLKPQDPGEDFQGSLLPYQRDGLSWLKFLSEAGFHGLLADDMGLGKTVQVLALFSLSSAKKPHLIVMPTSLLFNWRCEFEKFLPSITPYIHSGPNRYASCEDLLKEKVILTSYTLLRQDLDLFKELSYGYIVLDEAHLIKNPDAQVTKAVCSLSGSSRLALSGTPLQNRYEDLWSLYHFLMPQLLGERSLFRKKLDSDAPDPQYLEQTRRKIAPFMLRRTKDIVAKDLPPKREQTVLVEMNETQREFYDDFLSRGRQGLLSKITADGADVHRMEILELILRLRQICCHPALVEKEQEIPSSKLDQLLMDLEEVSEEGHKALIYSQFTGVLKLIESKVQERNIPYVYLDGATKNREAVVEKFQKDPDTLIFLSSLKAGGVGLNLQEADYVFLFDPWWNEAVEAQAIDRAHRLGRTRKLFVKRYIAKSSIEEKMLKYKETKTQKSLGLKLESSEQIKQLTTQALLELLEETSAPVNVY